MRGIHDGHRERVRDRFLNTGFDQMEEHEMLELVLFYSRARGNTNGIAHELINRFGSFAAVINAPYDELVKVDGIGKGTAVFLKTIPQMLKAYEESDKKQTAVLNTLEKCADYMMEKYRGVAVEKLSLLCLDGACRVCDFIWLANGSFASVEVSVKSILSAATREDCAMIAIAHNHPSHLALPSQEDVEMTRRVKNILASIGIKLIDHFIICNNDYVSMRSSEKFKKLFE